MIDLPSGCSIASPLERMRHFCRGEYIYYDGISSAHPDRIEPLDVLVTVAVNSFVNSAARVYSVHQGLRDACERLLPPDHNEVGPVFACTRWSAAGNARLMGAGNYHMWITNGNGKAIVARWTRTP